MDFIITKIVKNISFFWWNSNKVVVVGNNDAKWIGDAAIVAAAKRRNVNDNKGGIARSLDARQLVIIEHFS